MGKKYKQNPIDSERGSCAGPPCKASLIFPCDVIETNTPKNFSWYFSSFLATSAFRAFRFLLDPASATDSSSVFASWTGLQLWIQGWCFRLHYQHPDDEDCNGPNELLQNSAWLCPASLLGGLEHHCHAAQRRQNAVHNGLPQSVFS